MSKQNKNSSNLKAMSRLLLLTLSAIIMTALAGAIAPAQSPSPTPEEVLYNGYRVSSAIEVGYRWRSLDGNENKYRSDLNYKKGFRFFDTNLYMESPEGKGKYFDSLLITNTGWGDRKSTRLNSSHVS